ncbi:MAG: hypothetical protein N3D12_01005 [Candidatus Methanomethyliaceae archaeon]|nr:hypothetical protein [Candidatus Methanomethyliaceae archaeon]
MKMWGLKSVGEMPFTLFHLGAALAIGIPLRNIVHVPTLILTSMILDFDSFVVLVLGLNCPLHGYFHIIIVSLIVGVFLVGSCTDWKTG